ncbi:MAG: glycosyltransferase family 39 protein [Bdellovibrionales bacterium]|nr:glycosyltransferase family 39 protein [Bdellovibrionales bacterium]
MKWRLAHWELWTVFAVAILLRLIFVWQWQDLPYALSPFLDAKAYDEWAREIAAGQWLRSTAFYQSPLYPYALALLYKITGPSALLVSVLQAFLSALTCVLVAMTAGRYFGSRAALEAGLLAAMQRALIFYSAPLLKETLMVFCIALFVHLALLALEGRRWAALGSGAVLGLAVLLRGNLLLIFPALIVFIAWRFRRRAWRPVLAASLALAFILAPAAIHNFKASGDFVLSTYNGGFNFYIGNSPTATGANSYPPFVSTDAAQEEADVRRLAEEARGERLSPSQISHHWLQQGIQFVKENPGRTLALVWNKFRFFWNDHEVADNYDSEFLSREGGTVLTWPMVTFGFVVLFAVFGFALMVRRSLPAQFLLSLTLLYMGSALLFYVTDRYRLPVLLFLFPIAGAGTAAFSELMVLRQWRWLIKGALPVLPMAALCFWPLPVAQQVSDGYSWGLQATLYSDAGRDREAVEAIEKAVKAGPESVSAQAYITASTSYERLGDLPRAQSLLEEAVRIYPYDGFTFYNLGRFHFEHGRPNGALELYNKSLAVMPYHYQPYIGLGVIYLQRRQFDLAREAVDRGLKLNAQSPQLLQLRALLDAQRE